MNPSLAICIVTCDIVGPIRNGGIGTAYYNLAHALARAGHKVTVLYALGQFCENETIDHWQAEYAKHRIEFVPLPANMYICRTIDDRAPSIRSWTTCAIAAASET